MFKEGMICSINQPSNVDTHGKLVKLTCELIYDHWEVYYIDNPSEYTTVHIHYLKEIEK